MYILQSHHLIRHDGDVDMNTKVYRALSVMHAEYKY